MAQGQDDHPIEGHEGDIDSCLCDIERHDDEATSDADLPAAAGGVEAARGQGAEIAEDTDGCDLDFNESDPTTDEELPAAIGGIA